MDKQKFFNFLYVFLILALVLFMMFMVIWLRSESKNCIANPVKYFHDKNEHISCYCYDGNYNLITELSKEQKNLYKLED